jgi:ABC-type multidrug transport system fused ATPase/permease subunit
VHYNIEYGRPGAGTAAVEAAARAAHIDETLRRFPQGYDTVVGERGLKLSGGEKQRVAIARALLKDAPIVLADESTSALDSATEAEVVRTLQRGHGGGADGRKRTVVMIAHRLSTVKDCDFIFVLNAKGELAEVGNHAELVALDGIYADLWRRQLTQKKHPQSAADTSADAASESEATAPA